MLFHSSNLEFVGWLMGNRMRSCSNESAVFNNFTAVELEVRTGPRLTGDHSTCFTFSDNFTTICVGSKRGHRSNNHHKDKETVF
jgi:hypothetical protein